LCMDSLRARQEQVGPVGAGNLPHEPGSQMTPRWQISGLSRRHVINTSYRRHVMNTNFGIEWPGLHTEQ
jgi:hypothetical protein